MDRRDFLAALGVAGLGALAGCGSLLGNRGMGDHPPDGCGVPPSFAANRGDLPPDDTPTDGIPPAVSGTPPSRNVDPSAFSVATVDGTRVPLVPAADAHYWWRRGAARFADARTRSAYDGAHVYGAVSSPLNGSSDACDPVPYWPTGDRVVCYGAGDRRRGPRRAAALLAAEYDEVYAIDGGFPAWDRRGYPVAGTDVDSGTANATE